MRFLKLVPVLHLLLHYSSVRCWPQAPEIPIESDAENALSLVDEVCLTKLSIGPNVVSTTNLAAALQSPHAIPVQLLHARTAPLRPAEVCQIARASRLQVGWYSPDTKVPQGLQLASGAYAITGDGIVVACHSVLKPPPDLREAVLLAADTKGHVWPVIQVIADDEATESCLLQVEGLTVPPLPLNDQTSPGDTVYALSNPVSKGGYFTTGIVNRFFWKAQTSTSAPADLRMHVSIETSLSSNGSPVLDHCGNVICHIVGGRHQDLGRNIDGSRLKCLTLHVGVAARAIMSLTAAVYDRSRLDDAQTSNRDQSIAPLQAAKLNDDEWQRKLERFRLSITGNNAAEAVQIASELAEKVFVNERFTLNHLAWTLITHFPDAEAARLARMETISRRSVELAHYEDAASLDTLARILFKLERKAAAIAIAQLAFDHAGEDAEARLRQRLEAYRADQLAEVPPASWP